MKVVSKLEAKVRVTASLDQDSQALAVSVFAQTEYAPGRTTTAQVHDVPEALQDSLRAILNEIGRHAETDLGNKIQQAVFKSVEVGAQMGER